MEKLVGIGWVRFSLVVARRNDEAMTELKAESQKVKAEYDKLGNITTLAHACAF